MKLKILSVVLVAAIGIAWFAVRSGFYFVSRDRNEAYERWQWPNECEAAFHATHAEDELGFRLFPLERGAYLLEVDCARSAYQMDYAYMRIENGHDAQLLHFPLYEDFLVSGLSEFDPQTKELTISYRESSLDSCRDFYRYGFNTDSVRLLDQEEICLEE